MSKKNSGAMVPASIGYMEVVNTEQVPATATIGYMQVISAEQGTASYQNTIKNSYVDKATGAYGRTTQKESYSTGDTFKERSSGRVGYKDEYKTTSTTRVGDRSGYCEYQCEERYRRVDFDDYSSGSRGGNRSRGNKKHLGN